MANFSEGRDLKVLDAIVSAIRSVEAARVLDLQMDVDYHRSVVIFVSSKESIGEALLQDEHDSEDEGETSCLNRS